MRCDIIKNMKKKGRSLYYIILMLFLQAMNFGLPASAISEAKESAVRAHCDVIRSSLKDLQKTDSKIRVYLGRYYDNILIGLIKPLNLRLMDNDLSDISLINNQNDFNEAQTKFKGDYIEYQKSLEELVAMDCKTEPVAFYDKLKEVRERRGVANDDALRIKEIAGEQVDLVKALEAKI